MGILRTAGRPYPEIGDKLATDAHAAFLVDKGLRFDSWQGAELGSFANVFWTKEAKFGRIKTGADFVADSLEHWRTSLHPARPDEVHLTEVELVKSDLHERGLGVVKVKFTKPKGPNRTTFAKHTTVEAMMKPEDKSLEERLLGAGPGSAASKINEIADLTDPDEMLTTIRMKSDAMYGSLVELVKGTEAGKLPGGRNLPVNQSFHEALLFAFLTGLDDLHHENVFWSDGGHPYLVDADNVLS